MNPALELLPKKARDAASRQWREDMGGSFNITERLCRVIHAANEAMGLPTRVCETCHGKGEIEMQPSANPRPCPDCGGTGLSPEDSSGVEEEAVERAARASWNRWRAGSMVDWDQAVREGHPQVEAERRRVRTILESAVLTQPDSTTRLSEDQLTPDEARELFSLWLAKGMHPPEIHPDHPLVTGAEKLGRMQPQDEEEHHWKFSRDKSSYFCEKCHRRVPAPEGETPDVSGCEGSDQCGGSGEGR